MKKTSLKIEKNLPYFFLALFMGISLLIAGYVYLSFNRPPEGTVISEAKTEIDEISINFNKTKILNIFEKTPHYDTLNVPTQSVKNPFVTF